MPTDMLFEVALRFRGIAANRIVLHQGTNSHQDWRSKGLSIDTKPKYGADNRSIEAPAHKYPRQEPESDLQQRAYH